MSIKIVRKVNNILQNILYDMIGKQFSDVIRWSIELCAVKFYIKMSTFPQLDAVPDALWPLVIFAFEAPLIVSLATPLAAVGACLSRWYVKKT